MNNLSLFELNKIIRECLDLNLSPSYWVIAEISEMKVNQKGHCYLDLIEKKDDEILARARGTIWSYTYRNLSNWFEAATGEALRPGMNILANVTVSFHEVYGLSLNIRDIDASYTVGERARMRQVIMKKLTDDGVAEMNKEIPLPQVPQRIAVISSPTAAGYQDFTNQLFNNLYRYNFKTRLFKALMQGKEAELSIIHALHGINDRINDFDLVVIIRGGGAVADLDCFDSYQVASHVAQFPLPIITGIGHEKDETIVDRVAHTRLKTPTAVAEFLISGIRKFEETLIELFNQINDYAGEVLNLEKSAVDTMAENLKYLTWSFHKQFSNHFDLLSNRFSLSAKNKIGQLNSGISQSARIIRKVVSNRLAFEKEILKGFERNLSALNPESILKRGFSITRKNGKVIRKISEIGVDDILNTQFRDGHVESKVINRIK